MENKLLSGFKSTLKSSDTEEKIDIYFYRPIGYVWALFFKKIHVSPNMITILSIFLGVGAGICFYYPTLESTLLGILLLVWANAYDSADGQLARMTQNYSRLGRVLDGFAGDLWFASIYIALCLRLFPTWSYWIWTLAVLAGICHSKQAAMADYYRNIHLFFLKGKAKSELDNSSELNAQYASKSWSKKPFDKLVAFFYRKYTRSQEQFSPTFLQLFALLNERFGNVAPEKFRADFRKKSLPLMRFTNILSFNTRAIVLFVSVLAGVPYLYFLFEITVMNILLFYMISKHEKNCKQHIADIENGKYDDVAGEFVDKETSEQAIEQFAILK